MSRLEWNKPSDRLYEVGLDRGVFYPPNAFGVPWNGLISVSESPEGGELKSYYIDGFKYLNVSSNAEFAGSIEAYGYPREFSEYDGFGYVGAGLYIDQQKRKPFGLSYRTLIGGYSEDTVGYKIHLVYNVTVAASSKDRKSLTESIEPMTFSWDFSTIPEFPSGRAPSAHFVIDSRLTLPGLLTEIEDILYGTTVLQPRLPSAAELITIMLGWTP